MAHLIRLSSFKEPFTTHAYSVSSIERVEVVPASPATEVTRDQNGRPIAPGLPSVAEHSRITFSGLMTSPLEVTETINVIVDKANA